MIATTIISSINVKPFWILFKFMVITRESGGVRHVHQLNEHAPCQSIPSNPTPRIARISRMGDTFRLGIRLNVLFFVTGAIGYNSWH